MMVKSLEQRQVYILHGALTQRLVIAERIIAGGITKEYAALAREERAIKRTLMKAISDARMRKYVAATWLIEDLIKYGQISYKLTHDGKGGYPFGNKVGIKAAFKQLQKDWGKGVKIVTSMCDVDRTRLQIQVVRV